MAQRGQAGETRPVTALSVPEALLSLRLSRTLFEEQGTGGLPSVV